MKTTKIIRRLFFSLLIFIFVCLLAWIVVNFIDAPRPAGEFTMKDLKPASLDADNGYYICMGFSYPVAVDLGSPSFINTIRSITERTAVELQGEEAYAELVNLHTNQRNNFNLPSPVDFDWGKYVLPPEGETNLQTFKNDFAVLGERYSNLLAAAKVEDFSTPHWSSPLPNLSLLLKVSRYYTQENILVALAGDWPGAFDHIFAQVNFACRFMTHSRQIINNLCAHAILRETLSSAAHLMNHKDCPTPVISRFLANLRALELGDLGFGNIMINEYLQGAGAIEMIKKTGGDAVTSIAVLGANWFSPSPTAPSLVSRLPVAMCSIADSIKESIFRLMVSSGIFLQENRTRGYILEYTRRVLELGKKPPYLWSTQELEQLGKGALINKVPGSFWWVQNPVGKWLFSLSTPNIEQVLNRLYQTRAVYDMACIAAQVHLEAKTSKSGEEMVLNTGIATGTSSKSVRDILTALESYKALDPFSGEPYRYNESTGCLYSTGPNRKDDGGNVVKVISDAEGDIVLPCKL